MRLTVDDAIATERLLVRPLRLGDVDALVAYRSLPEVCRYVPFAPMDAAAVLAELRGRWAQTTIAAEGDGVLLGVQRRDTGALIGDVSLHLRSLEHRTGEIGWVLHPGHSGHGYATEAARAGLALAFDGLGLHRVVARVDARNLPSLRLAARLGMRREAHLVANEWFKGGWSDEIDLAMLDHEWERATNGPTRASAAADRRP